jgi:uncharacterized protein
MKRVLVDTGPLVAILSTTDQYHTKCIEALRQLPGPLFSCWPVLTEAAWLLRHAPGTVEKLLRGISQGFVELLTIQSDEAIEIAKIMEKYRSARVQLADAALFFLGERDNFDLIFTLDRRDFGLFQRKRKRSFRIVP